MPKPVVNANYFYRMRKSPSDFQGLCQRSSKGLVYEKFNGSTNDLWQLYGNKLKNAFTGSYIGGNTPALVAISSAPTVTFESGPNTDTYYVKASTGKYLNCSSSGVLEWGTAKVTAWYFERLIQLVEIGGYSGNSDFFSERCGDTTGGDWSTIWTGKVDKLYKALFGEAVEVSKNGAYLNLYGAMYNALTEPASYRGKFHTGIDLNYYANCEVYAPISGIIRGIDRVTWGTVCIEKTPGINFTMSHLRSIPNSLTVGSSISKGIPIGFQGNTGLGFDKDKGTHVHFEVTSATNLCTTLPTLSSEKIGSTFVPYSYI